MMGKNGNYFISGSKFGSGLNGRKIGVISNKHFIPYKSGHSASLSTFKSSKSFLFSNKSKPLPKSNFTKATKASQALSFADGVFSEGTLNAEALDAFKFRYDHRRKEITSYSDILVQSYKGQAINADGDVLAKKIKAFKKWLKKKLKVKSFLVIDANFRLLYGSEENFSRMSCHLTNFLERQALQSHSADYMPIMTINCEGGKTLFACAVATETGIYFLAFKTRSKDADSLPKNLPERFQQLFVFA